MSEEETREQIGELINNEEPVACVSDASQEPVNEEIKEEEIKPKAKPKSSPEPNQRLKSRKNQLNQ